MQVDNLGQTYNMSFYLTTLILPRFLPQSMILRPLGLNVLSLWTQVNSLLSETV